jgi:hypothetical protein
MMRFLTHVNKLSWFAVMVTECNSPVNTELLKSSYSSQRLPLLDARELPRRHILLPLRRHICCGHAGIFVAASDDDCSFAAGGPNDSLARTRTHVRAVRLWVANHQGRRRAGQRLL